MYLAKFYQNSDNKMVKCLLCSHYCKISNSEKGRCRQRINKEGQLYTLSYENLISAGVDPIEKKPLYHFLPGSLSFSIATPGCNMRCLHCQNYQISQNEDLPLGQKIPAKHIIDKALETRAKSIAYTYTEPTIFYEYLADISKLAKDNNLANIWISNGFFSSEVIKEAHPLIDACNIDLKAFTEKFYHDVCGASLKPVLDNIEFCLKHDIWLEITTLLIPDYNDSEIEIRRMAKWLKSLSSDLVWHLSAFRPTYKLKNHRPTSPEKIKIAYEIAKEEGLKYVYSSANEKQSTYCPNCQTKLVSRKSFKLEENLMAENGFCFNCQEIIAGNWL